MATPTHPAMLGLQVVSLVAGIFGNMFILAVMLFGWIKSSSNLSSCDLILSSLALSNLGHLGVCFVIHTSPVYSQAFHSLDSTLNHFFVVLFFLRCCSLWFATWFCVYCCVKIVHFTHPLLVRWVKIFQQNISWLLLGSVLVSLATCLPIALIFKTAPSANYWSNSSVFLSSNGAVNDSLNGVTFDKQNTAYVLNILLVFAVFLFSSVAIIATLCRHMRKMGQNAESFRTPSMEAHRGVVKTVSSLLLLYTTFCFTQCIKFLNLYTSDSPVRAASILVVAYFPTLNSLILVQGITKLKKALVGIFPLKRCLGKQDA